MGVGAALALAKYAARLSRTVALTVLLLALRLAALAPPTHLFQLHSKSKHWGQFLGVFGECFGIASECLQDCLFVGVVFVGVAAVDAVAVLGA